MTDMLTINGAFDAARVQSMRQAIDAHAAAEGDIELDMSACTFLDSSGVGAVVYLYKRKRARGYLVSLTGLSGQPLRLLRHLGVAGLLVPAGRNAA